MSGIRVVRRGGMQRYRPPIVIGGGLAMPQGPSISQNTQFNTIGFAQAADFYDSIGVNHHIPYLNGTTDVTAALDRLQELGIRHMRHALWSPAVRQNESIDTASFMTALAARPSMKLYIMWGTDSEPRAVVGNNGVGKYRIGSPGDSNPDDTFLRNLDGRTGTVNLTNWPASSPYYPNEIKYVPGTFHDWGWQTAAALQGPNEPDLRTWYSDSMRNEVHGALRTAKLARPSEVILGGNDYISATTGRITPGPAYAPQLPVVAAPIATGFNDADWAAYGDYTVSGEVDVAGKHNYWGAMQPSYLGQWGKPTSGGVYVSANSSGRGWPGKGADRYRKQAYNGALTPGGRYGTELPYFQDEEGWHQLETSTSSNRTPAEVAGEYAIRAFVHNYLGGARRTYYFALNDVSGGTGFPAGLCKTDWTKRASFYAVKNLLEIVGFVQGFTSQPITVTTDFTTSTAANNQWGAGGAASEWNWDFDGLRTLVLQRDDCHLIILVRDRVLWDQDNKVYTGVSDPKTVTVSVPPSTFTSASRAIPSLNANITTNGIDGHDYSWSGDSGATDGTNFRPWTSGEVGGTLAFNGTSFKTSMAGLTQVFRLTP